jgi:hypothetical protein
VAQLERLDELGETRPVMTTARMVLVGTGIVVGLGLRALYVWALQGV